MKIFWKPNQGGKVFFFLNDVTNHWGFVVSTMAHWVDTTAMCVVSMMSLLQWYEQRSGRDAAELQQDDVQGGSEDRLLRVPGNADCNKECLGLTRRTPQSATSNNRPPFANWQYRPSISRILSVLILIIMISANKILWTTFLIVHYTFVTAFWAIYKQKCITNG